MNNKICHISTVHSVFDTRVLYRECKSLAEAGNKVYLVIQHDKDETIMGVNIRVIKKSKNRFVRIFLSIFRALKTALKTKSQAYHFHDPELLPVGIFLRLLGKKVIYDVHENVPAQIMNKNWLGIKFFRILAAGVFFLFEKFAVLFCHKVISAEPELAKRFPKRKTVTVRNLPLYEFITKIEKSDIAKEKTTLIYAGGLSRVRGIKEIIISTEFTKNPVELWILGKWESKSYEEECRGLSGWKNTQYLGYVLPEQVYAYMKAADIGLCMLYPIKNHVKSIPIKSFEYAACGLPQIISNFPYFEEYFKEIADFADPFSPEDIAKKIDTAIENKMNNPHKLYLNKIIESKFSWEIEKNVLLNTYNELFR